MCGNAGTNREERELYSKLLNENPIHAKIIRQLGPGKAYEALDLIDRVKERAQKNQMQFEPLNIRDDVRIVSNKKGTYYNFSTTQPLGLSSRYCGKGTTSRRNL